ncbi:DUF397 domain-containing protein [Streptomyces sp. NPDC056944]|uniref:DUF397 domain-containing protein n=1 Tax=Streptomyces sp. NPDC056944 TaxID=3345972 RepID=UPI003632CC31
MSEKPEYRKSSYSGSSNDACVEVADNLPKVQVRDSKYKNEVGPEMKASRGAWASFIGFVQ